MSEDRIYNPSVLVIFDISFYLNRSFFFGNVNPGELSRGWTADVFTFFAPKTDKLNFVNYSMEKYMGLAQLELENSFAEYLSYNNIPRRFTRAQFSLNLFDTVTDLRHLDMSCLFLTLSIRVLAVWAKDVCVKLARNWINGITWLSPRFFELSCII